MINRQSAIKKHNLFHFSNMIPYHPLHNRIILYTRNIVFLAHLYRCLAHVVYNLFCSFFINTTKQILCGKYVATIPGKENLFLQRLIARVEVKDNSFSSTFTQNSVQRTYFTSYGNSLHQGSKSWQRLGVFEIRACLYGSGLAR